MQAAEGSGDDFARWVTSVDLSDGDLRNAEEVMDRFHARYGVESTWDAQLEIARAGGALTQDEMRELLVGDLEPGAPFDAEAMDRRWSARADQPWQWWADVAWQAKRRERRSLTVKIFAFASIRREEFEPTYEWGIGKHWFVLNMGPLHDDVLARISCDALTAIMEGDKDLSLGNASGVMDRSSLVQWVAYVIDDLKEKGVKVPAFVANVIDGFYGRDGPPSSH